METQLYTNTNLATSFNSFNKTSISSASVSFFVSKLLAVLFACSVFWVIVSGVGGWFLFYVVLVVHGVLSAESTNVLFFFSSGFVLCLA
jgi:hypothetical protein